MSRDRRPKTGDELVLLQAREKGAVIAICDRAAFANNVSIVARESDVIGSELLRGDGVRIMGADLHEIALEWRRQGPGKPSPVAIENNIWLGSGGIIFKGVTIGDHSIVAPDSVVKKSRPARVIAGVCRPA